MIVCKTSTMPKKEFKAIEKNVSEDILWEGEEVTAQSETKIEQDKGTGQAVILRSFDFVANPENFRLRKPTAQDLFASHIKGMEALLWSDGLRPFQEVQPRLLFSKNKKHYRFIIPCIAGLGESLIESTKTLSQLLQHETTGHSV